MYQLCQNTLKELFESIQAFEGILLLRKRETAYDETQHGTS